MEFIKDQEKRILLSAISREERVIKEHPELAELIPVIEQLDYYFMYDRLFKKIYEQGRADERKEWECAVADKIIKHDEDIYKALPEVIEKVRNDAIDEFIKGCKATHDGLICNWDKPYGITFERMEEKAKELKESKEWE